MPNTPLAVALACLVSQASPSPSPAPSASPAAAAEELPESYKKLLATLRDRKEEELPPGELRFGRQPPPDPKTPGVPAAPVTSAAKKSFPPIAVRAIKQVEGEWAAFLEGERRASYPGDVVKGVKIVRVDPDTVTFQFGAEVRKIGPKPVKQPFPTLPFNGIIEMATGRVVLLKGRPEPVKVGDVIDGAKILAITPTGITVEYENERRTLPPR